MEFESCQNMGNIATIETVATGLYRACKTGILVQSVVMAYGCWLFDPSFRFLRDFLGFLIRVRVLVPVPLVVRWLVDTLGKNEKYHGYYYCLSLLLFL
jgi:hypothetical protein